MSFVIPYEYMSGHFPYMFKITNTPTNCGSSFAFGLSKTYGWNNPNKYSDDEKKRWVMNVIKLHANFKNTSLIVATDYIGRESYWGKIPEFIASPEIPNYNYGVGHKITCLYMHSLYEPKSKEEKQLLAKLGAPWISYTGWLHELIRTTFNWKHDELVDVTKHIGDKFPYSTHREYRSGIFGQDVYQWIDSCLKSYLFKIKDIHDPEEVYTFFKDEYKTPYKIDFVSYVKNLQASF